MKVGAWDRQDTSSHSVLQRVMQALPLLALERADNNGKEPDTGRGAAPALPEESVPFLECKRDDDSGQPGPAFPALR
jgi:hypothetical protein